jgi:ligand-binding sensor domain-containing protein
VWWDVTNTRLYASTYEPVATANRVSRHYGWMQNGRAWKAYPSGDGSPRLIVSDADETLRVQIVGKQTEFRFLKTGQQVTADVPLPWQMGEPAWDERRIWVPTYTGLYEVDRRTGHVSWLAHQQDNPFFSVLRHGGRLYIATARGLYYRELPQDIPRPN